MIAERVSRLVEECYRLADQARRLAHIPGTTPEEKADLLEVEQRWLSIARTRQDGGVVQARKRGSELFSGMCVCPYWE